LFWRVALCVQANINAAGKEVPSEQNNLQHLNACKHTLQIQRPHLELKMFLYYASKKLICYSSGTNPKLILKACKKLEEFVYEHTIIKIRQKKVQSKVILN